jgi:hypothetical protein
VKQQHGKISKGSSVVQMQQEIISKLFPYHCHMNVNLFIKPINLTSSCKNAICTKDVYSSCIMVNQMVYFFIVPQDLKQNDASK